MLAVLLTFVGSTTRSRPNEHPIDFSYVLLAGGIPLVAAAFLTVQKLLPSSETSPGVFQTKMLICLAVAELGTLIAFYIHTTSGTPIWPLALGTLLVDIGLVLPRVLLYWRLKEEEGNP